MGNSLSRRGIKKNSLITITNEIAFDQMSDVTEIEYPLNQKELIYNNRKLNLTTIIL